MAEWMQLLTPIAAVLAALAGAVRFLGEQRQANRMPFLQRQLEISLEAAEVVSTLATSIDPAEWERARAAFWRLYWGRLGVVEDRQVEAVMVRIGAIVPRTALAPALPMSELQELSLALAQAARAQTQSNWRVSLAPLKR